MIVWKFDVSGCGQLTLPKTVDIELRDSVTGAPLQTIATAVPNLGYFFWNVNGRTALGDDRCIFIGSIFDELGCAHLLSEPFSIGDGRTTAAAHLSSVAQGSTTNTDAEPTWSVSGESACNTSHSRHKNAMSSQYCALDTVAVGMARMSLDDETDAHAQSMSNNDTDDDSCDSMVLRASAASEMNRNDSAERANRQFGASDGNASALATDCAHRSLRTADCAVSATCSQSCSTSSHDCNRQRRSRTASSASGKRGNGSRPLTTRGSSFASVSQPTDEPSSIVYSNNDGSVLWSEYPDFIYWAVYMDQKTIRSALRAIVKQQNVGPDTALDIGTTAGMFSVRYLLMLYYKKHITGRLEEQIAFGQYQPHDKLIDAWRRSNSFLEARVVACGLQNAAETDATPQKSVAARTRSHHIAVAIPTTTPAGHRKRVQEVHKEHGQAPSSRRRYSGMRRARTALENDSTIETKQSTSESDVSMPTRKLRRLETASSFEPYCVAKGRRTVRLTDAAATEATVAHSRAQKGATLNTAKQPSAAGDGHRLGNVTVSKSIVSQRHNEAGTQAAKPNHRLRQPTRRIVPQI